MIYTKKAFTLTELLIALGIIGAIAALSIPSLVSTIHNRMLVTQLKSITGSIQQLASDQMVAKKTKDLKKTDFESPAKLLTSTNFALATACADPAKDCWKTTASGSEKVSCRTISKVNKDVAATRTSIKLKNGAIVSYVAVDTDIDGGNDKLIGVIDVDVNGNDSPNIYGRDFFSLYITKSGKVVDDSVLQANPASVKLDTKKANCKGGNGFACYGAIVDSGWTMPSYD